MNLDDPINRPLCPDPKPMTGNRVLDIVRRRGVFEVTWHYRNADLRRACMKMCRAGLLRHRRYAPGSDHFILPASAPPTDRGG